VQRVHNDRSFDIFWKPLEAALKGINTVYVSADGVYNKLNLGTIYDPTRKRFLVDVYKFNLVSNLRDIVIAPAANQVSNTASLFSPVHFGTGVRKSSDNTIKSHVASGLSVLPGTQAEVEKIDSLLGLSSWSTTKYSETIATEAAVKQCRSTWIHIATHGFFIDDTDPESLIIARADKGSGNNPLLYSGLILNDISKTDSPDNADDGVLSAYEVKNLNLESTDLVVLSACETGSGAVRNGEGVYGLQRAFFIGGARNVLMSLWKVDDTATQRLMILFYQNLLSGQGKTDALRNAQSDLEKLYPHPYYWGGFVLIGKP
jgi:CHAT domain-containing protein